jgi:AcrR family transcriptional regulator
MPSLRERKKLRQREALIAAAATLFRDAGFERTRIEDIAALADVGVATVYNYFSNKQQILLEIVQSNTLSNQPAIRAVMENPPAHPVDAILGLIKADFGNLDAAEDKKLWRELLASMTRDQENRAEIEAVRALFRDSLRRLVKSFVQRRLLRPALDLDALVDICYAIYAYHFRQLVCLDRMTTQATLKAVRRDLKILMSGVLAD